MKLGVLSGYSGKIVNLDIDRIKFAESLGFDSVWTAEAYGSDAVTPATWILANTDKIKVGTAIMQMPARSPACTAMTAMTLNQLSEGRFIVGLGASAASGRSLAPDLAHLQRVDPGERGVEPVVAAQPHADRGIAVGGVDRIPSRRQRDQEAHRDQPDLPIHAWWVPSLDPFQSEHQRQP